VSAPSLIRCRYCPGASAAVRRVAHNPCPCCRARAATLPCPECGGTGMSLQVSATNAHALVVFCNHCEFLIEVTHE
jgi:hypothetical protein